MCSPPPRPARRQITQRKSSLPTWRTPWIGPVTPRLQQQNQKPSGPVVDATGFQRLYEGENISGTWVRKDK